MIESQVLSARMANPIIAYEVTFVAHFDSALPITIDASEHDAYGWFPFAEAYEKIRWTDDREALERVERMMERATT